MATISSRRSFSHWPSESPPLRRLYLTVTLHLIRFSEMSQEDASNLHSQAVELLDTHTILVD
jgi:hypothetical protein